VVNLEHVGPVPGFECSVERGRRDLLEVPPIDGPVGRTGQVNHHGRQQRVVVCRVVAQDGDGGLELLGDAHGVEHGLVLPCFAILSKVSAVRSVRDPVSRYLMLAAATAVSWASMRHLGLYLVSCLLDVFRFMSPVKMTLSHSNVAACNWALLRATVSGPRSDYSLSLPPTKMVKTRLPCDRRLP
jgi:hypothetical protein